MSINTLGTPSRLSKFIFYYVLAIIPTTPGATSTGSLQRSPLSDFQKRAEDGWPIKTGYVAFGDSYAAGMGTGTTTWDACRVGENNFGELLYRFTDNRNVYFQAMMCSGDTTKGLARQIDEWRKKNPERFDLATVSIGGNDIGFSDFVRNCVLGINPWKSEEEDRKNCEYLEGHAANMINDPTTNGLRFKLANEYKRIVDYNGRDDFHVYVTGYPNFFNDVDQDCDKTTFYWWEPTYKHIKKPGDRRVMLTTTFRKEVNRMLNMMNEAIEDAVRQANDAVGRGRIHFVDVNPRFQYHRWCETGNFHEPDENRADTWFFLSAWKDFEPDGSAVSITAQDQADIQELQRRGGPRLPNAATCKAQLGTDPDPYEAWMCDISRGIANNPNGELAQHYNDARAAWARGDFQADHIYWLYPTRWIKTFHPRTRGMYAYRDALIDSIRFHQGTGVNRPKPIPLPDLRDVPYVTQQQQGQGQDSENGNGSGQQIALASYIHPGSGADLWTRMIGYPNHKVSVLVANVLNGPNTVVDEKWVGVLERAAAARKKVVGYVRTGYLGLAPPNPDGPFEPFETRLGSRDVGDWIAQIESDVDLWYKLYGADKIGGIFFDEGWNECGENNVYAEVYRFISDNTKRKYPGAFTVLNPGTGVGQCYENSADTLMTFESSYDNYIINNYTMINWTPKDPRKIWHIIYSVPEDKAGEVSKLAAKNHVGLVHITDANYPNPYNTLPSESYMQSIMNALPGGGPRIGNPPTFHGGRPAAMPTAHITGADYTSLSMEWTYPEADPYGFTIYSDAEELARVPGYMRRITVGNLQGGKAMAMSVRAIGTDGNQGYPSPASAGGTQVLTGGIVRDVKISPASEETIVEAKVLLPYGFIRIYFTDSDRFHNYPGWPINYGFDGYVTAHYMVEGRTLFKYTGSNETDDQGNREWKWTEVGKRDNCELKRDKTSYKWIIPMGTSTEDVDPNYVIVQTEGYNPAVNVFLPCPSFASEKKPATKNLYCIGQPPYDCQGAPLCGHTLDMVKHCDQAVNSLVHGTTEVKMYTANKPLGESGMCSVNGVTGQGCKVYVQGKDENGKDCTFSGDEMWKAYQDIKQFSSCKKCGTKHFPNRCMVSRDYHFASAGTGCSPAVRVSRFLDVQLNNTAQM